MTDAGREYGEGLYALCREEAIEEEALRQLNILKDCFNENRDFLYLLSNRSIPRPERLHLLDETLRGRVHPYLLNFLKILLEKGMLNEYQDCVKAFYLAYCKDQGIAEATVTTATPLSSEQEERIRGKLCAMTGKKIILKTRLDESLLGGVLLEVDGKRYDDSLKGRLESIHSQMVGQTE